MTDPNRFPDLPSSPSPQELTVQQTRDLLDRDPDLKIYDVRTPAEYETARLDRSVLVDEAVVENLLANHPRDEPLLLLCHHGIRSFSAAAFFAERGFTRAFSIAGGIDAWSHEIDPSVPTY